ncbi:MAG: hypothetical protein VCD33_04510 [Alphaproteobacteria bacterium]
MTALPMAWRVERARDSETGARHCAVIAFGRNVVAVMSKDADAGPAAWTVVVGSNNDDDSIRYLRVDDAIFQTTAPAFVGVEASAIVQRLKRSSEFAFEWASAPDGAKRPGLFGTGDFAARAADCEIWMDGTAV